MLCPRIADRFSSGISSRFQGKLPRFAASILPICLVFVLCASAGAQVFTADFEDQTTDGFFPFGNPTVAVSNAQANTGNISLLTTNRTQTFEGPGVSLLGTLTPGQPYLIRVAARLNQSQNPSANLQLTVMSVANGSQAFTPVATATVNTTGWTTIQGVYTPPASGLTSLIAYVEAPSDATASYYIDSFSVSATSGGCTVPPDNSGIFSDFEDGTVQGWSTRFNLNTVTNTTADAHTGSHSLIVTGRSQNFQGPARDITGKMCNGQQYWVEAWVKMAPGQPTSTVNLSLQYTDATGTLHFPGVA